MGPRSFGGEECRDIEMTCGLVLCGGDHRDLMNQMCNCYILGVYVTYDQLNEIRDGRQPITEVTTSYLGIRVSLSTIDHNPGPCGSDPIVLSVCMKVSVSVPYTGGSTGPVIVGCLNL